MEAKQRQEVKARIESLESPEGKLTAERVVEDARDEASPLHPLFDWDDDVAAHKWRLNQARTIIRSIKVNYVIEERRIKVPQYIRDPEAENKQGYVRVAELRDERALARDAVESELARIVTLIKRARGIAGVLDLSDELEALLTEATRLRAILAAAA